LRLFSRGPSLAKLIRGVLPKDDVLTVARALLRSGTIARRGGWYFLISPVTYFTDDTEAALHSLAVTHAVATTVSRNMRTSHSEQKLLERAAMNFFVPRRSVSKLRQRIKRDLGHIADLADGFFVEEEDSASSEPLAMVGLLIAAFDDIEDYRGTSEGGFIAAARRLDEQAKSNG
jgi:hypothetical protein